MGAGDDVIATGLARGVAEGKRAAFGDGRRIIWGPFSEEVFRYNRRIARPGEERAADLQWIAHFKGHRLYNRPGPGRWIWTHDFRVIPGEIVFDAAENDFRLGLVGGFVLIEPNVPWHKSVAVNKDWGEAKFQALTDRLLRDGFDVVQFDHGRRRLRGVRIIKTPTFRHALAALSRARFALLPEGGLHHGAAAVRVAAVVIFGGFIPPQVVGYDNHINLAGDGEACGSLTRCQHCVDAMERISVEEVHERALGIGQSHWARDL